jgi:hypothetical protein
VLPVKTCFMCLIEICWKSMFFGIIDHY